jgi:hypothetical protein
MYSAGCGCVPTRSATMQLACAVVARATPHAGCDLEAGCDLRTDPRSLGKHWAHCRVVCNLLSNLLFLLH